MEKVIERFDNGDYITLEEEGVCRGDWWSLNSHYVKETRRRYNKDGKFICSWWNYEQI